jgi:DNA polymerase-3 subunit delta
MKFTTVRAFEKHLEGASQDNHFADLYLLISKESFERKAAEEHLLSSLLKKDSSQGLGVKIFEGESLVLSKIMEELDSYAFFSSRRAIVLRFGGDKIPKSISEPLEGYFSNPNPSVYLVVSASSILSTTNFYKKAEKKGIILDVAEEKPWEKEKTMTEWVHATVQTAGKRIDAQATHFLIKQIGTDQATLAQELEKLFCYCGDRKEIRTEDIGAICVNVNMETGWQLGEAIFRRDASSALRIAKALLMEGTAVIGLLRLIRSQFQTQYQVCSILVGEGGASEVTQQFPYMRGAILERNMQTARSYGMARFRKGLLAVDDTELKAKNSSGDLEFLVELLIVNITTN